MWFIEIRGYMNSQELGKIIEALDYLKNLIERDCLASIGDTISIKKEDNHLKMAYSFNPKICLSKIKFVDKFSF
jgi:hypothetical protein